MSASVWSRSSITRSPAAGHCHCFCRRAFSVSAIKGKARASSRHVHPAPANIRFPDRRIPRGKLIWALLLASGVASVAINLRNARDQYKALQSHHAAQVSVLIDVIHRLEQGVPIDEDRLLLDYERVGLVDRAQPAYIPESLTWKEMLFGRTKTPEQIRAEDAETAALEKSFEDAAQADDIQLADNARPDVPALSKYVPAAPQSIQSAQRPASIASRGHTIIV